MKPIKITFYSFFLIAIVSRIVFPNQFEAVWNWIPYSRFGELIIAVIGALMAAYLFLWLILKPSVKFSEQICKVKNWEPPDKSVPPMDAYVFKVVNNSIFKAYNINFELSNIAEFNAPNGKINFFLSPVELARSRLIYLAPRRFIKKHKLVPKQLTDKYAEFAFLIRTHEDLESILRKDANKLRLQITVTHGLSGVTELFMKEYLRASDIVEEKFKFGKSTEIH